MKTKKLLLSILALVVSTASVWAVVPGAYTSADSYVNDTTGMTDVTSYVSNADFSVDGNSKQTNKVPASWSFSGDKKYSTISVTAKGTNNVILGSQPHWQVWGGTGNMSQTLTKIPNGTYTMTCTIVATKIDSSYIFANDNQQTIDVTNCYYSVTTEVTDGTLTIGVGKKESASDIELDDVKLYGPAPETIDYSTLSSTINGILTGKAIGFEADEYAPYTLIDVYNAQDFIANEKAKSQDEVDDLNTTLLGMTFNANTEEVNAFYDPAFNLSTTTSGSYTVPTGWTNLGYNTRIMKVASYSGLAYTSQGTGLFAKFSTTYGSAKGYTLPLKAGTYYLQFVYGSFDEKRIAERDITLTCGEGDNKITITPSVPHITAKGLVANKKADDSQWSTYYATFKIETPGDYIFNLNADEKYTEIANQIILSDIVLKKQAKNTVTLNVNADAKFGTFVAPFDVELPTGVTAYTVSGSGSDYITLTAVEGTTLAAGTPVILENKTNETITETYKDYPTLMDDAHSDGYLIGVYDVRKLPSSAYILQKQGEANTAFYPVNTASVNSIANRCYLDGSALTTGEGKIRFSFAGDATAISAPSSSLQATAIYSTNGIRLNSLQHGVNLMKMSDGSVKKVIVK